MKRITAVMLLCIIVLCGCTQAIEPNNANTAPIVEETGVPTPPIREIEGIVPFMEYEGYYFYGTLKNESFIGRVDRYIDLENETTRPLCFVEGCEHNSKSCGACSTDGLTSRTLSADGKMLVYLTDKAIMLDSETLSYKEGKYDALSVSDLDGTNKRALVTLYCCPQKAGNQELSWVYYDGSNVYYTVCESNEDNSETRIIKKTNVATEETKELYRWQGEHWLAFDSIAVKDKIIIQEDNLNFPSTTDTEHRYIVISVKDDAVSRTRYRAVRKGAKRAVAFGSAKNKRADGKGTAYGERALRGARLW